MNRERLIVQDNWDETLWHPKGTAWVTYKTHEPPSVHSTLKHHSLSASGLPFVVAEDGFSVTNITRKTMNVTYTEGDTTLSTKFVAPAITLSTVHKPKSLVHTVDVTSEGLAVSADRKENLVLWLTENGQIRRELKGHKGDVYKARFFPSGLVVLSAGADMQIKVWSVETGKEAANIIGHTAAINDTAIIEKGRNVLSCGKDGTARLWDVGKQAELYKWTLGEIAVGEIAVSINCCAVAAADNSVQLGPPDASPSDREVLTEGKLLVLGTDNNMLHGFGLQTRKPVFEYNCLNAVNCCTFLSDTQVACGTDDGIIFIFDVRQMREPLKQWKESRSKILSLLPHKQGIIISTGDGSVFYVNEEYDTMVDFTGSDCEAVYSIASDKKHLYAGSRDGCIRKYSLNVL